MRKTMETELSHLTDSTQLLEHLLAIQLCTGFTADVTWMFYGDVMLMLYGSLVTLHTFVFRFIYIYIYIYI